MPEFVVWGIVFVVSLGVLVLAADFFIKSAERIGLAIGIPPFLVGVTLIAMGTSLPELVTSIAAVLGGSSTSVIVVGNVLGSNITNICLVLGLVGIVARKVSLQFDVMRVDLPMMLGAAILMYLISMDGVISFMEGLILMAALIMYLMYVVQLGRDEKEKKGEEDSTDSKIHWKEPIILIVSSAFIYLSAKYNVESIIELSQILEIGEEVIALTAVALGTSLPELVVSLVAIRNGNAEMAVGNVLGSNVFNIFAVVGIPRMFGAIVVPDGILNFSLPMMLGVTLLCVIIVKDRIVNRWEGWILLLMYLLFLIQELKLDF
ncbi:calcium/sodium antiporter [Pontibacter sp. G13]|uniref:calcium/sodium antiporter n=1 Tax=Pontibacter sp. G13 TaxID=3074898 RepID=UPI00288C5C70|nr:calcium/sodium antiporter [Pontibacter sp. G13]WNJ21150.1 calcium/sodium antiporter [Pontibacter sp. G13]